MAKKERLVPQDLTSGFEELPIVNSRPIDVFVPPSRTPTSAAVNSLISSLERINPALTAYKQAEYETFTKEQEDKAKVEFQKTKTDIKSAIKSGEIPVGASPEFINRWVQLDLKSKARSFKAGLWAEYEAQKIKEHPDPEAFNIFFDQYSAEFRKNNKLDGYDTANLAETFIPNTMSSYAELNSQHINGRVKEIERIAKVNLGIEIFQIGEEGRLIDKEALEDHFFRNTDRIKYKLGIRHLPKKDERLIYIAENIYSETQALVDAGLDTIEANKIIRDNVIALAVEYEDERLLKVFKYIPTVNGGKMANTSTTKIAITDARRTITELRIGRIDQEEKLTAIQDKHDTKAIVTNVTQFIDENGIENISIPQLYDFFEKGIETEDGRTVPIELTKRSQLITYFQNYKNSLTLLEEDKNVINEFYKEIMANPNDPKIKEELINALGTDITDTTFKAIDTFHNNAIANQGDKRMKTPEYLQIELDLDEIVGDYASGTVDKAKAVQAIKGLRQEAHEILTEQPDISNSKFLKLMEDKADSLLGVLLKATKLNNIIDARNAVGMEGTLLQSLKKITDEYSEVERVEILKIIDKQNNLFQDFAKEFSIMTKKEFQDEMNKLNNELLEIQKNNATTD